MLVLGGRGGGSSLTAPRSKTSISPFDRVAISDSSSVTLAQYQELVENQANQFGEMASSITSSLT